jgi:hypothetical protein
MVVVRPTLRARWEDRTAPAGIVKMFRCSIDVIYKCQSVRVLCAGAHLATLSVRKQIKREAAMIGIGIIVAIILLVGFWWINRRG